MLLELTHTKLTSYWKTRKYTDRQKEPISYSYGNFLMKTRCQFTAFKHIISSCWWTLVYRCFNVVFGIACFFFVLFFLRQKTKKRISFSLKHLFNKIFNTFIVCIPTAWCTRLTNTQKWQFVKRKIFYEFLKNPFLQKLPTDFETRTKRPAEDKDCVFSDVDH